MERLTTAIARLDQAILSLDRALSLRLSRADADRAELERALAEAKAGEAAARKLAEDVSARLDGAIGRLRVVLEE